MAHSVYFRSVTSTSSLARAVITMDRPFWFIRKICKLHVCNQKCSRKI